MSVLISAAFANLLPASGVPSEIVFIPEGKNKITPRSHPEGIVVNLPPERGQEVAARFQLALQNRLGDNVKPWLDFEHTRKYPASGYPTAFRYQAGMGLMASVDWSGSGKTAIENKDVRYFSPEFHLDNDGVPEGIPERGPLGGLVTEPAFREIPPVTASDAEKTNEPTITTTAMKLLLAALNISPDAANAESAAITAVNSLRDTAARVPVLEQEVTDLKGKVTAAEATIKDGRKAQGEALFARAVAAGLAKADDAAKKAEFVEAAETDNKLAVKFQTERIEAAEGSREEKSHLSKPLVTASGNPADAKGDHAFIAEARKKVTAGLAKTEIDAFSLVASERPDLYEDYNKQFDTAD